MQVAVTYKNGVLIPQKPLNLKRDHLIVSIPDELLSKKNKKETTKAMSTRERIDQIMGEYKRSRVSVDATSDKTVWQQHLSDKYLIND